MKFIDFIKFLIGFYRFYATGSEIEIITPGCPGPFLIAVKDTRLAIGEEIADQIMVS